MYNPNQKSVDAAFIALAAYTNHTGIDISDSITDLLVDLMHYCDAAGSGMNFDNLLERAGFHYDKETRSQESE